MTPRVATLLALALLLAGCSLPDDGEPPESQQGPGTTTTTTTNPTPPAQGGGGACADSGEASGNAPLLATMQEDPEQMASRIADAMGTPIEGPPDPREDGSLVWTTGDAEVTVRRGDDEARVTWERPGEWSPTPDEANATLRRALDAFQPQDLDAFPVVDTNPDGDANLAAFQQYEGRSLMDAGASLTAGPAATVTVFNLRDLRPGIALMDEPRAVEQATRAARCALDQEGLTEEGGHRTLGADPVGLGVRGASLAYVVNVRFAQPEGETHCGHLQQVRLDAVTGKVLSMERAPCD